MRFDRWFRFVDDRLNKRLLGRLHRLGIAYAVDQEQRVHYRSQDEERFEDLLADVRNSAFPSWQVLSCPEEWVSKYRQEMGRRDVPYFEEMNNGRIEFLLPRGAKPHSWAMT